MGKALIIYGYYDDKDHYGAILQNITEQLKTSGITEVDVINTFSFTQQHLRNNTLDLSAPTAEWFRGHRTPENDALIKEGQEKILGASHLIFVYPIWWESLPPFMMTWVSEVFRSVSFRVDDTGRPNPQWGGNHKVMIITTAGFSQEVRRENFAKLLPSQNLASLNEKGHDEIDKFICLAQTYPLAMALNYAGLQINEQLHLCGVDKGDEPAVLSAVQKGVANFVKHLKQLETSQEEEIEDPLATTSKTLLLSGGPQETSRAVTSSPSLEPVIMPPKKRSLTSKTV